MRISSRQISYFQVASGLVARIGAGATDDVLSGACANPSVLLCVREPLHARDRIQQSSSVATLTCGGPEPNLCTDSAKQFGAWAAAVNRALHAVETLSRPAEALSSLPMESTTTWWLMDVATKTLRRIGAPDQAWLDRDAPKPELLRDILVRMNGSAGALLDLLSDVRQEFAAIDRNFTEVDCSN
jgi:hypothetical protein